MNGLMNRYKDSLAHTPAAIPLNQCKKIKLDLSGLMKYAKEKGVQPVELSEEEKERFILE